MDRINHPTAPNGAFTDGDPGTGTPGTVVTAAHMNAVQEELIAAIEAAGLAPDGAELTQLAQAIQVLGGGGGGLQNLIINGGFQIWQRGSAFQGTARVTNVPVYTADRWEVQGDTGGGVGKGNVTRVRDAQAPTVTRGVFDFLRYQVHQTPDEDGPIIRTKLEAIRQTSGQTVTLSFLARMSAAQPITVRIIQDGFQSVVVVEESARQITEDWARYELTVDVPAVTEIVQPIDSGVLTVEFALTSLVTGTFDLAQVQLELGQKASTFERRNKTLEHQLCRRYFQKSWPLEDPVGSNALGWVSVLASVLDTDGFRAIRFAPELRATPTIQIFTPAGNPGPVSWGGTVLLASVLTGTTSVSLGALVTVGQGPSALTSARFHYTADAEL